MKRSLLIIALAAVTVVAASCVSRRSADQLESQRDSLNGVVQQKDALLSNIFSSLNIVTENLNTIKQRENIVSSTVASDEIPKENVAQINEDIVALDELIKQNNSTIAQLRSDIRKLKQTAVQVSSLEAMVTRLSEDNAAKNQQIVALRKQVDELTDNVETLNTELATERERNDTLVESHTKLETALSNTNEMLHTAYYVVGSKRDLIDQEVVLRSKKLFGEMKINTNRSLDIFTRVNTDTFTVLPIEQSGVELISSHPVDSYRLIWDDEHRICRELSIIDPIRFWERSKVLVVSYK